MMYIADAMVSWAKAYVDPRTKNKHMIGWEIKWGKAGVDVVVVGVTYEDYHAYEVSGSYLG